MSLLIISILIMSIGIIALIGVGWWIRCPYVAFRQRQQIIDWVFAHKNYEELLQYYDGVSYHQHNRALLKFQNPFKLYDPDLFSAFHMIKHGPSPLPNLANACVQIPYIPKAT